MKFFLDLDEQQKKLLNFCFKETKQTPTFIEQGGELYVGEYPDLQIDTIISALTEVYFLHINNQKLTELINETIVRLNQISQDIMSKIDFDMPLNNN